MFLLYEYDIIWVFLIISSLIPILAFLISGVLAPFSKEPEMAGERKGSFFLRAKQI